MKRLAAFIPVAAFAAIALLMALRLTSDAPKMPSGLVDRPLPAFALPALEPEGKGLSNADFGGKVVLLNVFASWCPVCRQEHPMLMRLAREGVVPMYGVNWKDKPGKGAEWLKTRKSPYVRAAEDRDGAMGAQIGVTGVPETYVVDKAGRVRYRHEGPITPKVWREVFEPVLAHIDRERG